MCLRVCACQRVELRRVGTVSEALVSGWFRWVGLGVGFRVRVPLGALGLGSRWN